MQWQNRAHFFAMAARLMRRILVDAARARGYQKRGGGAPMVSLDEALVVPTEPGDDLVALDDALTALAAVDPAQESGGGNAILRRPEPRGDGRGAAGLARHGQARLEDGEAVAAAGAARRRAAMTSDRWRQIEDLCHAALARPDEERAAFLAAALSGDDVLRREVESLLAQESQRRGFLSVAGGGA